MQSRHLLNRSKSGAQLKMHESAKLHAKRFFHKYGKSGLVVDIGSQDVNGSLKDVCPYEYLGVDFVPGKNVDVVLTDPYKFPFEDNHADIVVSSSCFEHSEFFWLTFLEMVRVSKDLIYVCAPSTGKVHRYPVDCWRFYPDAGQALANWANRSGYKVELIESFTDTNKWGDWVAIFRKCTS
jgi:hypothetical protein